MESFVFLLVGDAERAFTTAMLSLSDADSLCHLVAHVVAQELGKKRPEETCSYAEAIDALLQGRATERHGDATLPALITQSMLSLRIGRSVDALEALHSASTTSAYNHEGRAIVLYLRLLAFLQMSRVDLAAETLTELQGASGETPLYLLGDVLLNKGAASLSALTSRYGETSYLIYIRAIVQMSMDGYSDNIKSVLRDSPFA